MSDNVNFHLEYRVKPVTRYVITRYYAIENESGDCSGSTETRGEYDNADVAWEVAYSLCEREHRLMGPLSPENEHRIKYPLHPECQVD